MKWLQIALILVVGTGYAQAQTAPPELRKSLPPGALSLKSQRLLIGPNGAPVWLHLWTIPKGRDAQAPQYVGERVPTGPVKRAEISTGPSLVSSPFGLDVFSTTGGVFKINSVRFNQTKDANSIAARWLDQGKRAPVLLLHFGYTHWHEWEVIAFPKGLTGPAHHQTFLWGGEGESGVSQSFTKRDRRGFLEVNEEESDEGKITRRVYGWNGREWLDASRPYFVIIGSAKTLAGAQKIQSENWGEIRPSSNYKLLQPGLFVVINDRFATRAGAQERVEGLRKNKTTAFAYWKRAF